MTCCICTQPISVVEQVTAYCWTDPNSIACVAHFDCLVRIGEPQLHPGQGRRWS